MTITDLDDGLTSTLLVERARRRLTEAAELVEYVLIHRLPTRAVPDGQPGAPRGSSAASAPLNVNALDDADELVTTLLDRAHRWRTTLGIVDRPRIRALRYAYQVPLGFRPETTPAGARQSVEGITGWLLLHHDDIARHPSSGAYFDEIARLVERVYSRFPLEARPDRPHWKRPCEVCGEFAVTADWSPDAEIRDVTVWCESCTTVLITTTGDGGVRTRTDAADTAEQRAAGRKLARIVKQIAVGTTVPKVDSPEVGEPHPTRCPAVGVDTTQPDDGNQDLYQCVRRAGHTGGHQVSRPAQPTLVWSHSHEGATA